MGRWGRDVVSNLIAEHANACAYVAFLHTPKSRRRAEYKPSNIATNKGSHIIC